MHPAPDLRVALVHDYLTQHGGAERVVVRMLEVFPGAPLYTSLYEPGSTFPEFADADIRPSLLDHFGSLRSDHRRALPLLALTFSTMRITDADVVLASSSGWAHGVRNNAPIVVYCHNPARWLYQTDQYLGGGARLQRNAVRLMRRPLVRWDRKAAGTASKYLCQSSVVRDRIRAAYGIDAEVLPPPAGLDATGPTREPEHDPPEPGFVLCAARLLPYKNVDALIAAFASLPDHRLIVAGDGPERARLAALAGPNVQLVGTVDDAVLRWYYANCAAVVAASYEDFGLTPLEGLAFGRPSVVVRWGGFLDTVVEGETGVFFEEPDPAAIAAAVRATVAATWDADTLARHAHRYSSERFATRLREVVATAAGAVGR